MKVKDLIELLECEDPETLVVLSSDSEGNSFMGLDEVESDMKFDEGEVSPLELTEDLKKQGYTEEDIMDDGVPCIVLYP